MTTCYCIAMSGLNEVVPTHSLDGAAADGHHPLRRMFSTSVLGSLLRRDIGNSYLFPVYCHNAVNNMHFMPV